MTHLAEMIQLMKLVEEDVKRPEVLKLSLFFHEFFIDFAGNFYPLPGWAEADDVADPETAHEHCVAKFLDFATSTGVQVNALLISFANHYCRC